MTSDLHTDKEWTGAFVEFGFDAAVGRLFKGIIHNLNGVGQAFSMQTELLHIMFDQADHALDGIIQAERFESAKEQAAVLKEMLAKRAKMAKLLTGEVNTLQEIMRRSTVLMEESRDPSGAHAFKLRDVINTEIEFMNSDGFFKHKINKEMSLAGNIPALARHRVELHQIVSVLFENASQAMADNLDCESSPCLTVSTNIENGIAKLQVVDNGPGIGIEDTDKVFAPFYTTKEGHLGLGLFLAREMAGRCGGTISFESEPGRTSFSLLIPVREADIEN